MNKKCMWYMEYDTTKWTELLINNYRMMKSDLQEAIYKNYSLGFLDEATSRAFYCYYYGLAKLQPIQYNCYTKTIAELFISRTKEISTTLVIDFGTSNTALGA